MEQEALIQNIATALKDSGIVLSTDAAVEKAKLILGKVEVYQPEKPPELEVVKFEEPETQPESLETYAPDEPDMQKPIETDIPDEPDFQDASDMMQEPIQEPHDATDVIQEPNQEQAFEQEAQFPDHSREEDQFVEKYSEIIKEEFKQEDTPNQDTIPEPEEPAEAPDEEGAKQEIWDTPPANEGTQEQNDFEPETSNAAEEVAKPEPWVVPPAHEHAQTNIGDFKIGDKQEYDPSSPEYDVTKDTRTLGEIQRAQEEMHEAQPEEPKSEHTIDDIDDEWEEDGSIPPPKEKPKNDEFVSDEEFEDEDHDFSPPPRSFSDSDEESAEES